jgi:hypothetical protein
MEKSVGEKAVNRATEGKRLPTALVEPLEQLKAKHKVEMDAKVAELKSSPVGWMIHAGSELADAAMKVRLAAPNGPIDFRELEAAEAEWMACMASLDRKMT